MTPRDRELWDALVYNAYDSVGFPGGAEPNLEDRRTAVIHRGGVSGITVCIEPADLSYTGERLEPFANRAWLARQIERWSGRRWNGTLQGDCGIRQFGVITVKEGDPDEFDENVVALTKTARVLGRWSKSDITFNPDKLRDAEDFQVEVVLAHELGHAFGFWHTEPGTGFVMDAHVPRSRRMWPAKERQLAQLAYDVGPDVDYPGFAGSTPVSALPFLNRLFRWLME